MTEIRNLNELICSKLPIHYVMDGANVEYNGDQTFSFDKLCIRVFVPSLTYSGYICCKN